MTDKIIIVGAGAWGTAIANLVAQNGFDVCAISDNSEICEEINKNHTHKNALPQVKLSKNLTSSLNLEQEALSADYIFIVVPSNAVLPVLQQISRINLKENCGFIICTKGLEHNSLKLFHQIFSEIFAQRKFALLSGPNFAIEVAQNIPTITNIASKDEEFAKNIARILENDWFKTDFIENLVTVEISAVIKNIMAIACGICDELGLGENSKAALIIKGINEIKALAHKLGEKNPNLENAAGFGDIFLTCATTKSRNNSLGHALARGEKYHDLSKTKTYEGAINAASIAKLAQKLSIKLPLCQKIDEILQNNLTIDEIRQKIVEIIVK